MAELQERMAENLWRINIFQGMDSGQGLPWEIRAISITPYHRKSTQDYIKENAMVDLLHFSFLKAAVILFESIL